jgi:hypothetical protein
LDVDGLIYRSGKDGRGKQTRIGVVGKEGVTDIEGLEGWLTAELEQKGGGSRRVQGGGKGTGEVALRVVMAKWTHRKTEQLIRGLEAVMMEEKQKDRVSTSQVLRVREVLEPLTVSPLDKGGKQLLVECGLLYKERLRVGMVDADEYGEMEGSVEDIMKEMKRDYSACALDKLAPWGEECVPPAVGMPKHKAPKEKTRIVNSYAKGPARVALRLVSKALTWIFRQLPSQFRGFTLGSVTEAKKKINEGNARILKGAGEGWRMLLEQQDVVRMFTNLGKQEIRDRAQEVLDEAARLSTGRGGRRCCVTLIMTGKTVVGVKWGRDETSEENRVLTFEEIMLGVEFDLAHNYCGVGMRVLEQLGGCPIGGLLSALYADIYCAHDERNFCKKWQHLAHRFYGVRQVDDLLLVMRWDPDEESQQEIVQLRDDARGGLYTGGPESEVEEKIEWLGKKVRVWAGMQLRVGDEGVICKTHNKNEESIRLRGVQDLPRYTQGYSYQGDQMRVGLMLGNARRLREQCTLDADFLECLELDLLECSLIGTKWELVSNALNKMPKMIAGPLGHWQQARTKIRKAVLKKTKDAKPDGAETRREDLA